MPRLSPEAADAAASTPARASRAAATIERLDQRHNELLTQIDDLNGQILKALADASRGQDDAA